MISNLLYGIDNSEFHLLGIHGKVIFLQMKKKLDALLFNAKNTIVGHLSNERLKKNRNKTFI